MRTVIALMAVVLLFPSLCFALVGSPVEEKPGNTYFELKGGQYRPTGELKDRRAPNGSNVEINVGHRFSKYFSAEIGYGHTKFEGNLSNYGFDHPLYGPIGVKAYSTIKLNPVLASVKFMYPIGEGFLYAGGGYGRYRIDYKIDMAFYGSFGKRSSDVHDTQYANGWHYQLGASLDVNNNFSLGVEYKEFRTEEIEIKDQALDIIFIDELYFSGRIISGFIQYRF